VKSSDLFLNVRCLTFYCGGCYGGGCCRWCGGCCRCGYWLLFIVQENALFGTGRKDDKSSLRSSTVTAETDAVEVLSLSRDDLNTLKEIGHLDKQTMQALNAQAKERKRKDAKLLRMKQEEAENKNRLLNHVRGSITHTKSVRKLQMIGDAAEDVMVSDNIGNDQRSQKMKQAVEILRQHIGNVCKNETILVGVSILIENRCCFCFLKSGVLRCAHCIFFFSLLILSPLKKCRYSSNWTRIKMGPCARVNSMFWLKKLPKRNHRPG